MQLGKEDLAIVCGVGKFHSYIYHDHQPLYHLLNEKKSTCPLLPLPFKMFGNGPAKIRFYN